MVWGKPLSFLAWTPVWLARRLGRDYNRGTVDEEERSVFVKEDINIEIVIRQRKGDAESRPTFERLLILPHTITRRLGSCSESRKPWAPEAKLFRKSCQFAVNCFHIESLSQVRLCSERRARFAEAAEDGSDGQTDRAVCWSFHPSGTYVLHTVLKCCTTWL